MPAAKKPRARSSARPLPVITVARFETALLLIEQLVTEKQDLFLDAAQRFREKHRDISSRALNAVEAAQVAAGLMRNDVEAAVLVQQSGLRAYDDPAASEVFVAAGLSTAPAFLDASSRLVALIEMPADAFEAAYEADAIGEAINNALVAWRNVPMPEARERATAALDHFAKAGGATSAGEAMRLVAKVVMQAHQQAVQAMLPSDSSSLIGSLTSTDGLDEPSSTTPATATP
jgi:hypothetical protein